MLVTWHGPPLLKISPSLNIDVKVSMSQNKVFESNFFDFLSVAGALLALGIYSFTLCGVAYVGKNKI